jgi:hypothetical protein
MAIGTPKEYDNKNKDLEDLRPLSPELPEGRPVPKEMKKDDPMAKTFGQECEHEEEMDEKEMKAKSLSDFIEIIIKLPR